ncbi:hypothetical protein K458DRAFT_394540 [Lentithecium fluviatile CBS 122367]|uniref:Uncharacterized protein n=1 Tax=Lentithecium fluviatile CBS 122367 TaxID=1168545 RepID=A0A6G1ILM5_9PLEO|nr:hypothetical protein K458DRAFT_394540 [Lentithecium fluviatile CBS 122367]
MVPRTPQSRSTKFGAASSCTKVLKPAKSQPSLMTAKLTAIGETSRRRPVRPRPGSAKERVLVKDAGFGVGRAPGGDTEPFPSFVDATPVGGASEYHCPRHCQHYICSHLAATWAKGSRRGAKYIVMECSDYEMCRLARRKRLGLRALRK